MAQGHGDEGDARAAHDVYFAPVSPRLVVRSFESAHEQDLLEPYIIFLLSESSYIRSTRIPKHVCV